MAGLIKRGRTYYAQYDIGGKRHRKSLKTNNYQIAKAKLREIELKLDQGCTDPFPTSTPIQVLLAAYLKHVKHTKTAAGFRGDCCYLRESFGPICPELQLSRGKTTGPYIERDCAEEISRKVKELSRMKTPTFASDDIDSVH